MGRTTLVTAFYPIRSKFSVEKYLEWISNFMMLKSPIVLFTDAQFEPIARTMRGALPIHIIVQPFEQTYMWRTYREQWNADHGRDREAHIHTPELYSVWANKAVWVKEAIEANPFSTEYFFWCDIGAFRDRTLMSHFCEQFPDSARFVRDRVLFSSVERCTPDDYEVKDGIIGNFFNKNRIVGGLFGGEAAACMRWLAAYESMLQRYFSCGRFAGKDQSVMISALLENSGLGVVIKPTIDCNEWFFLEYYLSNVPNANFSEDITFRGAAVVPLKVVSVLITGGLGNQMFQLATAYAFARHLGGKLQILREKLINDGRTTYWNTLLENWKPYLTDTLPEKLLLLNQSEPMSYLLLPDTFAPDSDGYFLNGYFQTSKYFSKYCADLYGLFTSSKIMEQVKERYSQLLDLGERAVVVHARRTDYQRYIQIHGHITIDYYVRAIAHMSTSVRDPVYLLFSDDVSFWYDAIKQIPQLQTSTFIIVNETDTCISLMLMTQFSNFIIANSTFSWWSAWLSRYSNRCSQPTNVVVPKDWFGPEGPREYENIYEADWHRM